MSDPRLTSLVRMLQSGQLDRRQFLARVAALGAASVAAGGALQAAGVAAQGTPSAGGSDALIPANLGTAGIEHITDTSKGTINIYSSWPLTGASEQLGGDMVASVKYALEIYGNAAGGYAIKYNALDDGIAANNGSWDGPTEAANATKVVNDKAAMVYIATYNSGAAEASIPITNEAGMAQISPGNTAVQLTKQNPTNEKGYPDVLYPTKKRTYMRVVPADDLQGAASANWALNELGAKSAYILHDNQTYGKGVATVFQDSFKELGGKVNGFEPYNPNSPEYQALMTKIAATNPDLLYVGAISDLNVAKVIQDMRSIMSPDDVAFMGPDGLANADFIKAAGDAGEGAYVTFAGLPANELKGKGKTYYDEMSKRLGHGPSAYAIYAFEAAVVTLQAIDKVGANDRAKILDAMFHTKDFRGLIGTWSFTDTGDTNSTTVSLNLIKGGQLEFQKVIEPAKK